MGLYLAISDAKERRKEGETFGSVYWKTGNARVGAAVFQVFIWSAMLLASNAGLSLVGYGLN
ncbi:MAG: hypothetical protein COA84_08490 [Robiginitomaculum sp.]|nr:MAG: hypothetical protein COA84_08490 [Robiginitomaculum sp.]